MKARNGLLLCVVGTVGVFAAIARGAWGWRAGWDVRDHMASMTTYERRQSVRATGDYAAPAGCRLVSLDMVLRHGSRFPTGKHVKTAKSLEQLLDAYRGDLKLEWLKTWRSPFKMEDQGLLCGRGVAELRTLGANASRDFRAAVLPYNANEVAFTSTFKSRTAQSASAFGNAMVDDGGATPIAVLSQSREDDVALRFFDNCPRYTKTVLENPQATAEAEAWLAANIGSVAKRVAERTGLRRPMLVQNPAMISTMWSVCQSEYVVNNDVVHWCSVFDEEDVRVLEFYDDLAAYHVKSYGNALNYQIAAPLLADIVASLRRNAAATPDDTPVRANLRFAHAETTLPLAALLGLHRAPGEYLAANMTLAEIDARTWRFSAASPLAANFAFAQYACDGAAETQVELLYNGVAFPLRGCTTRLCPLSTVEAAFNDELNIAQNFADFCKV